MIPIQPLIQNDFYKQGHYQMYPKGTTKVYSNLTARKSRIDGINTIVVFGLQYFIKEYLINQWNTNFFNKPWEQVEKKYLRMINATLGVGAVTTTHIKKLHDLGYLPLKIKSIDEGASVPIKVPFTTITNTIDHAYWLVNFIESIWSCIVWQPITSATKSRDMRKVVDKYAMETVGNTDFCHFLNHDFSFRGQTSLESACTCGAGHLLSFRGTDTIPAIEFLENYYNANVETELVGVSIPASEHAVASFNIISDSIDYNKSLNEFIERTPREYDIPGVDSIDPLLIKEYIFLKWYITEAFPDGPVSYVGDTYNIFRVISEILPRLKPEILNRNGKLVIRPDSFWTNPIDCLCGYEGYHPQMDKLTPLEKNIVKNGLIESLWNIFGGTTTEKGYKLLDSHIGSIYGDSITKSVAIEILERFKNKKFATINSCFGFGSWFFVGNCTRDSFGMAIKATYGIVDGMPINVFKDPVSDDGMKKSAKGLIRVDLVNGQYSYTDCVTPEEEEKGELKTVFLDGKLLIDHTLAEIRERVSK